MVGSKSPARLSLVCWRWVVWIYLQSPTFCKLKILLFSLKSLKFENDFSSWPGDRSRLSIWMFLPSANHHHVSWKVKINNFFASHKFCLSQLEGEDKHCFANDIFILREKTFWPDYFESLATPPYLGRESFAQWTAEGTQIRIKSSTKSLISLWFSVDWSY